MMKMMLIMKSLDGHQVICIKSFFTDENFSCPYFFVSKRLASLATGVVMTKK